VVWSTLAGGSLRTKLAGRRDVDKRLFVIMVAVGAALISTLVGVLMQGHQVNRATKRLLWISLGAGLLAPAFAVIVLVA
jgi:hypothetical protein